MCLMKRKILQLLLNKLYILKKSVCVPPPPPCLSLSPSPQSQTPSPCCYPQTATGQEEYKKNTYDNHNNSILYANIFIEVH